MLCHKFIFKQKRNEDGEVIRYEVQLVVKSFEQIFRRNFSQTKSPTARMESFWIILHLAAANNWEVEQIDQARICYHLSVA